MAEKYTEAQKRAAMKYMREKTDSIQIRSKRGTKERWRNAAIAQGKSLNRFVIETVEREIAANIQTDSHAETSRSGDV